GWRESLKWGIGVLPDMESDQGEIMSFSYAAEKFASARSALMLPHPNGEDQSIATAFFECRQGLDRFDRSQFDESSSIWIRQLDQLMSTDGLEDPDRQGLFLVKARKLSVDDQIQLSTVVDELQFWFRRMND
ncbi:hypothetical protein PSYPI_21235, partial [Pseudomonas syringae pv. pisi str. 1704B]